MEVVSLHLQDLGFDSLNSFIQQKEVQTMEQEVFEDTVDETTMEPKVYDIHFIFDGISRTPPVTIKGFLGVNDVFMAVADNENRLIFSAPLSQIHHAEAVQEIIPITMTKN